MSFDFDAWRLGYDAMTYEDHVATYSELWQLYPIQRHFDAEACGRFLDTVHPARVIEIGGWDGEMAASLLATRPWIESWSNFEICQEAVAASGHRDSRFTGINLPGFIWDSHADLAADALVMSHSAEHMRWMELMRLLERVIPPVRAAYFASPLPVDGSNPDWNHYPGTHILEVGWNSIGAFLQDRGLWPMGPRTHEVRCWAKIDAASSDR